MARKFFYVCPGMFLLALSYHLGASTATAQAPGNPVVSMTCVGGYGYTVITANGDVYGNPNSPSGVWAKMSNIFTGAPVPTQHESWGQVKARYRNAPGMSVTPGADDK